MFTRPEHVANIHVTRRRINWSAVVGAVVIVILIIV
jgi:hypothetical protein